MAVIRKARECKGTATIYLRHLPVDLRNQFKSVCAKRGTNMTVAIIDFMRQEVNEEYRQLEERPTARARKFLKAKTKARQARQQARKR